MYYNYIYCYYNCHDNILKCFRYEKVKHEPNIIKDKHFKYKFKNY